MAENVKIARQIGTKRAPPISTALFTIHEFMVRFPFSIENNNSESKFVVVSSHRIERTELMHEGERDHWSLALGTSRCWEKKNEWFNVVLRAHASFSIENFMHFDVFMHELHGVNEEWWADRCRRRLRSSRCTTACVFALLMATTRSIRFSNGTAHAHSNARNASQMI